MKGRLVVALVVCVGLLSSCASTPHPRVDIGMARIGLTEAFTDQRLMPLPPNVIVQLVPALTPAVVAHEGTVPGTPIVVPPACRVAAADATVPGAAPLAIPAPPKPGFYKLHNTGTIKIAVGPLAVQFPYPAHTYEEVRDVRRVETSPVPALTSMPKMQFTIVTTVLPTYVLTDTYQYDISTLDLVHHGETNNGAVISDDWFPPVEVFDETGIGKMWQDIGASVAARRTFTITGNTTRKRVVDVCGSLIETVEELTSTTIVDAKSNQTSGTTAGKSDVEAIATSAGGLAAYREIHTTDVVSVNGTPATIQTDVASTLDQLTPSSEKPA